MPADERPPLTADVIEAICTNVHYNGRELTIGDIRSLAGGRRILYLYAGQERRIDAAALGKLLGASIDMIDIERHPSHDLKDQHAWDDLMASVDSGY